MEHARTWNPAGARSPLPALQTWLGVLAVSAAWWAVVWRQSLDIAAGFGADRPPIPIPVVITITVAGRIASLAVEALCYQAWWRSWGAPFRFGRFLHAIAWISLIDAWSITLRAMVRDVGHDGRLWLAPLLGIDLLKEGPPGSTPTGWIAFGTVGVLTGVRLLCTGAAQRRETGRSWAAVLSITLGAWLVTRIIAWWSLDLMRGASPLP